jgi:hypothetical protein
LVTAGLARPRRFEIKQRLVAVGRRLARPARPVAANLISIPLTLAGYACIDVGVFSASRVAGWIVTGISLMVLEHQIADDQ